MGSRLESNSNAVRKRIENHTFSDEAGEEYEPSAFGGFSDYFRRKKIKLQNLDSELRASSPDKPQIFKGIVAHVSGYTQPPLHVLHRDLVQHGAGFLQYLDSKTMATHIIASSLPPKKMVDFNKYRIVKPAWVVDSISAGRLLPWTDYRVIEETPRQKTLKLNGNGISTQARSQQSPSVYREQTGNSFYTPQLKEFANALDNTPTRSRGVPSNLPAFDDELDDDAPSTFIMDREQSFKDAPQSIRDNLPDDDSPVEPGTEENNCRPPTPTMPDLDNKMSEEEPAPDGLLEPRKPMTSEEHNAILLQDPRMKKSSTANPDFIQQYYSESRLHHLSTWKAELKSRMQKLAAEKGGQKKALRRKPGMRRYILHVDFDSFFCAVSLKSAPEFVDKPAVVAHGTGSGSEIASCNYVARKFGVKNGMWMKRAKELCPELKVLPYDFPAYEDASRLFYECILEIGGVVQSVSIDEALIDASSLILSAVGSDGVGIDEGSMWREQENADQIALSLRDQIKARTGCAVSVGIGGNILLAKVALRKAKPAGQHQIKPEEIQAFLGGLKVDDLPGVAYSTAGRLEEIGVKFVNDIRQVSKDRLINTLGQKTGAKLWDYARGIDNTEVGDQPIRKSVSAEVNWGIRFISQEQADEFVLDLCKELEKRLLNEQVKGKQLTMKIMRRSLDAPLDPPKHLGHGKCDTFNKSVSFGVATHDHQALGKEAISILRSYNFSPGDLRGLGAQLTKLEPIKALSGPDSSQKKLNFGTFKVPGSAKKSALDPIQDNIIADRLPELSQGRHVTPDPIVDGPLTPRKPKFHSPHPVLMITQAGDKDAKARTSLNITGTQFILPSSPDPAVLAALPQDIRSKLMAQGRAKGSIEARDEIAAEPRAQEDSVLGLTDEIPPEFDPEVFNALPEDMKKEILSSYKHQSRQLPLQQSPRKERLIQLSKKTTPVKRRGPRPKERLADANAGIVQTSLFSNKQMDDAGLGEVEELDADFLAELPEDVRNEVIADHRRRKAQRSGLDLKLNSKRNHDGEGDEPLPGGQTRLQFPPRPPKITFTNSKATTLAEIRDILSVWHRETSDDGPHQRDVEVFGEYLARVIVEERDMDKAQKLIKWLDFLIDADESEQDPGKAAWCTVVKDIKQEAQKAMQSRGLGSLDIG